MRKQSTNTDVNERSTHQNGGAAGVHKILRQLKRARLAAFWVLLWEELWPRVLPIVGIISVFLIISWLHIWPMMPDFLRISCLIILGAGLFYFIIRLRLIKYPTAKAIDGRIERASGLENQPLLGQVDEMVLGDDDAMSGALWREHRRRMLLKLENLQVGLPTVNTKRRDPYALRMIAVLGVLTAFAVSFYNPIEPLFDAFQSNQQREILDARLDAWVDPPAYTQVPPIFLKKSEISTIKAENSDGLFSGIFGSETDKLKSINANLNELITVPNGSLLVVRTSIPIEGLALIDAANLTVSNEDDDEAGGSENHGHDHSDAEGLQDVAIDNNDVPEFENEEGALLDGENTSTEISIDLVESSTITLQIKGEVIKRWQFEVIDDQAPEISFVKIPTVAKNGSLTIKYNYKDDYGVAGARAEMALVKEPNPAARPLFDPPEFNLHLAQSKARSGQAKTNQDLTTHPWAGSEVELSLVATDDIGQDGYSKPYKFTLPSRYFSDPLARAIIYERKRLALDANDADDVAAMLGVITEIAPEFIKNTGAYIALRMVKQNMRDFDGYDEELRKDVDLLWEIALGIEDGDLSLAQKKLREAQEELSEALENEATDEEIADLTENLREAMKEFIEAMKNQMAQNEKSNQPSDSNTSVMRQQDLMKMLDRIESLSKSGAKDAARKLLSELQQMMDNVQTGKQQEQQAGQDDELNQEMNKLGDIIQNQQGLMNETFQKQQNGELQPENDDDGSKKEMPQADEGQQEGEEQQAEENAAPPSLNERQKNLGEELKALGERFEALGIDPTKEFGEAGDAMNRAEKNIKKGDGAAALNNQASAIDALRKGAQSAMKQIQEMAGQDGQGQGQANGQARGQGDNGKDPLGRQLGKNGTDRGDDTKVPDEIDTQRARDILDAIRKKLSDPSRSRNEKQYLERLLDNLK